MTEFPRPAIDLAYRPLLRAMKQLDPEEATAARSESSRAARFLTERAKTARVTRPELFEKRTGFSRKHLDQFEVFLPTPLGGLADDVVPIGDDPKGRLDYMHFSVVMCRSRRMALFTAVNIEGCRSVSIERASDKWALDGRIAAEQQLGEDMYSGNRLDRGHLVRREDPNWGENAGAANDDTFHFTNCAPQMDVFNQREWLGLENYILRNARAWKERCSVFTGPVFGSNDIQYRGALVPRAFWKVVVFLSDEGKPSATAYLLTQDKELQGLEAAFGAYKTYQRSVSSIEKLSGLSFNGLADYDGFSNEEAVTGLEISSELKSLGAVRV
jgi:endonuclease G